MTELQDVTRLYAAIKFVNDSVKELEQQTKGRLERLLDPGDRKMAVTNDGAEIGTVSRAKVNNSVAFTIVNETALMEWAKQNGHSDAIEPRLADWFTSTNNINALVNAAGEIPDGVDMIEKQSGGYVSIRQSETQKETILDFALMDEVMLAIERKGLTE